MLETLLIVVVMMLVAISVLLCILLYLAVRSDPLPILHAVQVTQQKTLEFGETLDQLNSKLGSVSTYMITIVTELQKLQSDVKTIPANAESSLKRAIDPYRIDMGNLRNDLERQAQLLREELLKHTTESAKRTREEVSTNMGAFTNAQRHQFDGVLQQLRNLTESNDKRLAELRTTLEEKLRYLQQDNAKNLAEIRQTVDEKLQGTLEKRLGESFQQVVEQLRLVDRGVGEMQTLVAGVGDLRRILSNVKSRGMWGETQLERMLEDMFTRDQYVTNVSTKFPNERVEFAIQLPGTGKDSDDVVLLPIDAKFPLADYHRLIDAQEKGDPKAAEEHAKSLEGCIKSCAEDISKKYRNPPKTTDFVIMYLPTEGLFAEVVRRPGLAAEIQKRLKVVIAGPSTLWSILMGLQMGFASLRIERRSSEVLITLEKAKQDFADFGRFLRMIDAKLRDTSSRMRQAIRKSDGIESVLHLAGTSRVEFAQGKLFDESQIELPGEVKKDADGPQQESPSQQSSFDNLRTSERFGSDGRSLFT